MFTNMKTCENEWSNFSENLRMVALKYFELTRLLSPNLSIFQLYTLIMYVVGDLL